MPEILCVVIADPGPPGDLARFVDDLAIRPHVARVCGELAVITGPRVRVADVGSSLVTLEIGEAGHVPP